VYHLFFNLLINGLLLLINGLFFIISLLFYLQAWSESYRKIIFERIFNARGNSATVKKKLLVPKLPELVDGEEEGAPPQKSSQVMHDTAE
jgi:hypothetical protein